MLMNVWSQKNKVIEDRNGHTQLFASPSVNAEPNKYLGLYKTCRNYALLQDTYDGYQFFAVIADGEVWYVAVLPDTDQYTTYTGEPYQREAVTDGTVFQVTGTRSICNSLSKQRSYTNCSRKRWNLLRFSKTHLVVQ